MLKPPDIASAVVAIRVETVAILAYNLSQFFFRKIVAILDRSGYKVGHRLDLIVFETEFLVFTTGNEKAFYIFFFF